MWCFVIWLSFVQLQHLAQSPVFVLSTRSGTTPLVWLLETWTKITCHTDTQHAMVRKRKANYNRVLLYRRTGDTCQLLVGSSLGILLGSVARTFHSHGRECSLIRTQFVSWGVAPSLSFCTTLGYTDLDPGQSPPWEKCWVWVPCASGPAPFTLSFAWCSPKAHLI